jgi:hypothetical protein
MSTPHRFAFSLSLALGLLALGCGDAGRIDTACSSNTECAAEEYCAAGFCSSNLGVCNPRPTECDDTITNFVCGCDGQTYQSACFAQSAGVNLASTPGGCVCADNSECVAGQYCALDNSCTNRGGCVPAPETCDPADTQQVCGCDKVSYANACEAAQAGVRVSALGDCDCTSNADCAETELCNAIVCDGPGVCEAKPTGSCSPDDDVTGCDGVVYDSACSAYQAGQRVRPEG